MSDRRLKLFWTFIAGFRSPLHGPRHLSRPQLRFVDMPQSAKPGSDPVQQTAQRGDILLQSSHTFGDFSRNVDRAEPRSRPGQAMAELDPDLRARAQLLLGEVRKAAKMAPLPPRSDSLPRRPKTGRLGLPGLAFERTPFFMELFPSLPPKPRKR
eukprot:2405629-Prymnesium_polylepis.1